jgi:hypothetical protein
MQEKLQKKILIPLAALAIVAVGGTAYTLANASPRSAHAQAPAIQQVVNKEPDKETQDDAVKPSKAQAVQPAIAHQVNQQDNGADGETQDGN